MQTFGECLRRPRRLRGVMRGRWVERSESSDSLLRRIAVGQPFPFVSAAELMGKLLAPPTGACLNIAGIVHGESHMDCRLREAKPTANRKNSSTGAALSIFGTSRMRGQHELELDCILAWSISVFIPQKSDSKSDSALIALCDKSRISADDGRPSVGGSCRCGLRCSEAPERA